MKDLSEFRHQAHQVIDWIIDYYTSIEDYPVKSNVKPREIYNLLPPEAPLKNEPFDDIMKDFREKIIPGITHWQSPNFFAYFPGNSSLPSILGEMITAALGAQCMKWETSPAAAELEELVMNWLKKMTGLPENFHGVIQDSASSSTLSAILSAREKYSGFSVNNDGVTDKKFRVYCSCEAHSSVEKGVKIAGLGKRNLVKIEVDDKFALLPSKLEEAIKNDMEKGFKPLCIVAALGTTGSTGIDPLKEIALIARKYDIWLHIDAAFGGSALILPEYRWMIDGIEMADSLVFNPHKWLFTNFDCSAYFVKDKEALINTFQILPEYLKTKTDGEVNNYCDWGIPLGRRFRALKLWFVIRSFGVEGLQKRLREHISYAEYFVDLLNNSGKYRLLAPLNFNLVCFQYVPDKNLSAEELNKINEKLLHKINSTGKIYITHTKLNGIYTLRLHTSQTYIEKRHVEDAFELIEKTASALYN